MKRPTGHTLLRWLFRLYQHAPIQLPTGRRKVTITFGKKPPRYFPMWLESKLLTYERVEAVLVKHGMHYGR